MLAKRFCYTSLGILALALAHDFWNVSANAQASRSPSFDRVVARQLAIVDESGRERVILRVANGAPSVALTDTAGRLRAFLALKPDGAPLLTLNDASATTRAALQVTNDSALLTLANKAGKARAQFALAADTPMLSLMDEPGTLRASLVVGKNKENVAVAALTLFDKDASVIWQAPK
jgi:hypothetical protein